MDINECRILICAAEEKNFSQVAKKLFISPSVVSKTIKKLEEEFNTSIFDRNSHRVSLSADGKIIVETAAQILLSVDEMLVKLNQNKSKSHSLSLWCSFSIEHFMPEIYNQIKKQLPEINFEYSSFFKRENSLFDFVIIAEELLYSSFFKSYDKMTLVENKVCVVVSSCSPLSELKEISLKDIRHKKAILLESNHSHNSLTDLLCENLKEKTQDSVNISYVRFPNMIFKQLSTNPNSFSLLPMSVKPISFHGIHFIPITDLNLKTDLVFAIKKGTDLICTNQIYRIIKEELKNVKIS